MTSPAEDAHFIVLSGGGYAAHAENEGKPIADWLGELGIRATVLPYPVNARHPVPLEALRAEVRRLRATGTGRVGVAGFSAGGHLAGQAAQLPARGGARSAAQAARAPRLLAGAAQPGARSRRR